VSAPDIPTTYHIHQNFDTPIAISTTLAGGMETALSGGIRTELAGGIRTEMAGGVSMTLLGDLQKPIATKMDVGITMHNLPRFQMVGHSERAALRRLKPASGRPFARTVILP
jgi:hypothetical protein